MTHESRWILIALTVLSFALGSCGGGAESAAPTPNATGNDAQTGEGTGVLSGFDGDLNFKVAVPQQGVGVGADGEGGIAVGSNIGIIRHADVTVYKLASGEKLGSASTGSTGLVTVRPGRNYAGGLVVEVSGTNDADYYDVFDDAFRPFPQGALIRATIPSITGNIGVGLFSDAMTAYLFARADERNTVKSKAGRVKGGAGRVTPERLAAMRENEFDRDMEFAARFLGARLTNPVAAAYSAAGSKPEQLLQLTKALTPASGKLPGPQIAELSTMLDWQTSSRAGLANGPIIEFLPEVSNDASDGIVDGFAQGQLVESTRAYVTAGESVALTGYQLENQRADAVDPPGKFALTYFYLSVASKVYAGEWRNSGEVVTREILSATELGPETRLLNCSRFWPLSNGLGAFCLPTPGGNPDLPSLSNTSVLYLGQNYNDFLGARAPIPNQAIPTFSVEFGDASLGIPIKIQVQDNAGAALFTNGDVGAFGLAEPWLVKLGMNQPTPPERIFDLARSDLFSDINSPILDVDITGGDIGFVTKVQLAIKRGLDREDFLFQQPVSGLSKIASWPDRGPIVFDRGTQTARKTDPVDPTTLKGLLEDRIDEHIVITSFKAIGTGVYFTLEEQGPGQPAIYSVVWMGPDEVSREVYVSPNPLLIVSNQTSGIPGPDIQIHELGPAGSAGDTAVKDGVILSGSNGPGSPLN